ncbi:hypothetical protein UNDKW_4047 [Undibacterium sp. KW1]|uniref:helix-turn-helix domain-containing protein n=1 Tax=Undibacterium sp. KW1 TaxID=2058624 RepID=UPI001331F72D|nr:helix-turn-helix transcriptional regulator [Undibacterium sp. KW1]BBB62320.1 hypothetical protein UNDKW_4047 [Undibacterium sp. KW1]
METILGNELRKQRTSTKVTLRQVANIVGCTAPYLHRIEAGCCAPTDQAFLIKLAQALMLNHKEQCQFIEYASESQRTIRISKAVGAEALRIINQTARNLEMLEQEDLQKIEQILNNARQK